MDERKRKKIGEKTAEPPKRSSTHGLGRKVNGVYQTDETFLSHSSLGGSQMYRGTESGRGTYVTGEKPTRSRPNGNSGRDPSEKATPRKKGGPVKKGKKYIVGEKGPEIFVPKKSGKIKPTAKKTIKRTTTKKKPTKRKK